MPLSAKQSNVSEPKNKRAKTIKRNLKENEEIKADEKMQEEVKPGK